MKLLQIFSLLLAISLGACGKPALDCSSDAAHDTLTNLIKRAVFHGVPDNLMSLISFKTALSNVRTVTSNDRSRFCRANIAVSAAYLGKDNDTDGPLQEAINTVTGHSGDVGYTISKTDDGSLYVSLGDDTK